MGEIQGKFTVFRPLWRNSYSFPVSFSCSTPRGIRAENNPGQNIFHWKFVLLENIVLLCRKLHWP